MCCICLTADLPSTCEIDGIVNFAEMLWSSPRYWWAERFPEHYFGNPDGTWSA